MNNSKFNQIFREYIENNVNEQEIDDQMLKYYDQSGKVEIFHYSNAFDPEKKRVTLIPEEAKKNQNYFSRNSWDAASTPRVFFYPDIEQREKWFREGVRLYHTWVPTSNVYDVWNDPDGYVKEAKELFGNWDFEEKLFDFIAGKHPKSTLNYDGIFAYPNRPVIMWFEPIVVERVTTED